MNKERVKHTLNPIYDQKSTILILGSIPSPKSREVGFYYSHPQNRFWKILSDLFHEKIENTNLAKQQFLLNHHIALWDVLKECEIKGADDSSICNIEVNDIKKILDQTQVKKIYTTGLKATNLYKKYCYPSTNISSIYLPSTSPANCRNYDYDRLLKEYQCIYNDVTNELY